MPSSIRRDAATYASDRLITRDEASALVNKAKSDGKITAYEKTQLRSVLKTYADLFQPGAADLLKPLLTNAPTPPAGGVVILDPAPSARPVFLSSEGEFTVNANGSKPRNVMEQGEAMFRVAELVDDSPTNVFAGMPEALRQKMFTHLTAPAPSGLDAQQTLQFRASNATALLHLLEASPETSLKAALLSAYESAARGEPDTRLKQSMIFHLSNSSAAQSGAAKKVADQLMGALAPVTPPYEKWFANGNKTINLSWTVGSEFMAGFQGKLQGDGWTAVPGQPGAFEKKFNDPRYGETSFRITTKLGGSNLLEKLADPGVQIVGYDGHANWGKNQMSSISRGPNTDGDGKLFISNLCVGKSQIDAMNEKYPRLQYTTTFGSSAVDTDIDGIARLISERAGWEEISAHLDDQDGEVHNNFVTPISTLTRERVLDRDNDGQADYLDKHFNFSTFSVAADTAREFRPVKQERPPEFLDGTKINIAAQSLNTTNEFNGVLKRVNSDSKVVANGWFEPKMGETDVMRFTKARGPDGKTEYRMEVSARYAHMSEEALRATAIYELNRWLQSSGEQTLPPMDRKLMAVIGFAQSLDIDDGFRDAEVWKNFLDRYNLPPIDRQVIQTMLDAEHHEYGGSQAMVNTLKASLPPAVLAALQKPEAGEPVRII